MIKNDYLQQAVDNFSDRKIDKEELIPGLMGIDMGGSQQVECTNRPGYVWVRLHGNSGEFIQAYNDSVPIIYDMPILVARNPADNNRYYVISTRENHIDILSSNGFMLEYWTHDLAKHYSSGGAVFGAVLRAGVGFPVWEARNYPVWLSSLVSHADWDGDVHSAGTTTFIANGFNSSISAYATAILVIIHATWANAGDGNYLYLKPSGAANATIIVRSHVAGSQMDATGIVPLDGSHQFDIVLGGDATTYTYVGVWGYWSPRG